MEYAQDYDSRVCLNRGVEAFDYWGLVVVVDQKIADLQRWDEDGQMKAPEIPPGPLLNFQPEGQRLKLFMGKQVLEWNLTTGWAGDREFSKKEKKSITEWFKSPPGEPQFRAGKDWCCVIIDGDVKVTSPQELFEAKQKEWNELSAAQKSILLSEKARKSSAKHAFFGAKAAFKLSAAAAVIWCVAWAMMKLHII